jgi:osmotically inducible protein OsmC
VPIATRTAEVIWEGSLARGSGALTSGSNALHGQPVTWAARAEAPECKTSPEELLAAAHTTCFTMCVLAEVQGTPRITDVTLHVRAYAPSLDESAFDDAVARAAALCPVTNALRGNVEISLDAVLATS